MSTLVGANPPYSSGILEIRKMLLNRASRRNPECLHQPHLGKMRMCLENAKETVNGFLTAFFSYRLLVLS